MNSINWEIIKDLESKTNAQVIKKLIDSFINSFSSLAYQDANLPLNDHLWMKKMAHQVKSTAAMLGAMELSELAFAIEKSENLNDPKLNDYLSELRKVTDEFKNQTYYL